MGYKKNMAKNLFPHVPGWEWDKVAQKKQWKKFKSDMGKLWDQYQDMQKVSRKAWKAQWETFFAQLIDMQQTVADSLPDEKPAVPGMPPVPVSPKEFVEKAKEFQEKANAHAVEQADAVFEIQIQTQQQVKDAVSDAVEIVEANLDAIQPAAEETEEKAEAKAEEQPAQKPAQKKPAQKKPAQKKPAQKKPAQKPDGK